jgi:hypothetical protein
MMYLGMLVSAFTSAVCTLVAVVYTVRAANRALARSGESGGQPAPPGRGWFRMLLSRNRPWVKTEVLAVATLLLTLSAVYQIVALSRAPAPRWNQSPPSEAVRSAEWETWRAQVHEKLSAEPVDEQALIEAVRIKVPSLPNAHSEAEVLRQDQAIADVLMSYKGVKKLLSDKFGIRDDFLGTGLSKPLGSTPYALASVHEYWIKNHRDTHEHVWFWKLNPPSKGFSQPIQTLIAGDKELRITPNNYEKEKHSFDDELKEILIRVRNKDHPLPPMIRFARFDEKYYEGTVGHPGANRVFTSNLSEVWDLTVQQAAERSGYSYKDKGDTLFIWVIVPYHSNEFAPATWRQLFVNLPDWLGGNED